MAIQFGQIRGSQIKQSTIETGHIRGTIDKSKLDLGHLTQEDQRLQGEIDGLKAAIGDKNSNTKVFETMDEFNAFAATAEPKVGDLVFVIDVKKSYIYRGEDVATFAAADPQPPAGWMFFDEISSEVDLAEYAKTADMQAADKELDGKITAEVTARTQADEALDGKITAAEGKLTTFKSDLKATSGATLVGAQVEGIDDTTVQGVLTGLDTKIKATDSKVSGVEGRVATLEGKVDVAKVSEAISAAVNPVSAKADANEAAITKLNGNDTVEGSVDYKIKASKQAIETAQGLVDQEQNDKIKALEDAVGSGEGSLGQKIEKIESKNEEQDTAINANKQALHVHRKLVKSISASDDKTKLVTPSEFDIPQGVDGLYEDCTHVYVNGILQAEGINFSFINATGEAATEGKGKGVSFGAEALVEGDTVVVEWVEKRFPQA